MEFKCETQLLIYINSKAESNVQFVLLWKKQKNSVIMLPYHNLVDRTLQSTNGILSIPFTGINRPRSDNDDDGHQNHDQGGGNDDDDDYPNFPQPNHPNGGNDPVDHHHNQNDDEDQS
uniref:Putative ribonuclease H-like protein n=1 Tax=Moniliophthora roreri TaxID=221103 RepID=A0A0W0F6Z0_MONRR